MILIIIYYNLRVYNLITFRKFAIAFKMKFKNFNKEQLALVAAVVATLVCIDAKICALPDATVGYS